MQPSILVVDDNTGMQTLLSAVLEDQGFDIVMAQNGAQALEKLNTLSPALILLDYMMPLMDAPAFMKAITRQGKRGDTPVLLLTASGDAQRRAREIGADGALNKPFDIDRLLDLVATWTKKFA
jgi:CheY-like chemotaxis protein